MKKKILIIIIILVTTIVTCIEVHLYKRKNVLSRERTSSQGKYTGIKDLTTGSDLDMACDSTSMAERFPLDGIINSFKSSAASESNSNLGFATGGARTIENFRENIENGYFPISTDITYNGLFYDYSFDTGNAKGESNELFYPSYSTAVSKDPISEKQEYYMTVGLNSNIKESDFVRPKLNLVVVLDVSASMESTWNSYYYDGNYMEGFIERETKSKMLVANNSVNTLLDHLNKDDRFALVTFSNYGKTERSLREIDDSELENLKMNILNIGTEGGTNFEAGYREALRQFDYLNEDDSEYQNRIIVITDAMPNMGYTDSSELMNMIQDNAKKKIYTSFIGVGVDFNTELIEKLGTVEGANYYSVHNEEEFIKQMSEDFDFMVTPLVFDLNLDFDSKDYELVTVYGTDVENNKKGNIMHVNTLFPSKRNEEGEVKGGIILLKLKKKKNSNEGTITLKVSYRDGKQNEHSNLQSVSFENKDEYYDNTGIRKGIALTRYANLLKDWILFERSGKKQKLLVTEKTGIIYPDYSEEEVYRLLGEHERTSVKLISSKESKELFKKMKKYLEREMKEVKDDNLKQEIDILDKLI